MKFTLLLLVLSAFLVQNSEAQLKEAAQLATLTPTFFVMSDNELETYKKLHYSVSTIIYLSNYMITDSIWKSAVITLLLGTVKELVYDGMFKKGEMLFEDMKWNALGVTQGTIFTMSLKF